MQTKSLENMKKPLRIYIPAAWKTVQGFVAFKVCIYYQRHYWVVWRRFRSFDILHKKLEALKFYSQELRSYPHPRSLKSISNLAKQRGVEAGFEYAEALTIIKKNFIICM